MAPDRTHLLTAYRLPHILSVLNCTAGEEHSPVGGHHFAWDRRRALESPDSDPAENGERNGEHEPKSEPQFAV
jgi:hypothetical protein